MDGIDWIPRDTESALKVKVMNLEVSEAERELLLNILRERLGELREQVYHSTTSTFTEQLKTMEAGVNVLIGKLEAAAEETG
jgi:hypothetical protein